MRKCLTLSGIICFCVTSRAAVAQHSYTVELVTSDLSVKAAGVNSAGQVVGTFVSGGSRAFLWHDGVLTNLGALPGGTSSGATAINENGVITGTSTDNAGSLHAFRYSAGVMTDLGTLGGTNSGSYGTNGSGEVVGYSNMAGSSAERAFRHDGSTMTGLGTLSGGVNSAAYGINDAGEIVGSSNKSINGEQFTHAFLYRYGHINDLGTLPGGSHSLAYDINNRGHIVGYSYEGPNLGSQRGFVYRQGIWTSLGMISGFTSGEAYALNDAGKIVGSVRITGGPRNATLYRASRLQNLNGLIPSGTGWVLERANAISENGLIVGTGRLNGAARSFLLRPRYGLSYTPDPDVQPADPMTIQWTAPDDATVRDWVGLFKVGDPDTSYRWWTYTGGSTTGFANLKAPTTPGEYEFRYFHNNSYQLTEVSASFTIRGEQITGGLSVSSTSVLVNAPLSVSWAVNPGRPQSDWIGLYRVGEPNTNYVWWRYTMGATTGTFDLTAPAEPGQYEFRYLMRNGFVHAFNSQVVTISRPGSYYLTGSPATVPPGGSVTVEWTAPAGSSSKDWIALYVEGEPSNRNYLWPHWFHTGGAESGSRTLTLPTTPGRYVLRYLLNNGYTHVVESAVIQVQ